LLQTLLTATTEQSIVILAQELRNAGEVAFFRLANRYFECTWVRKSEKKEKKMVFR
jgi:hypothetical protein